MKIHSQKIQPRGFARTGPASPRKLSLQVTVTDRVSVSSAFYAELKTQIEHNIAYLHNFERLVPEDLIGLELWCEFGQAEKRMARICIAHLSQTGALPIRALEFDLEYPEFYVLRGARLHLN